MSADGTRDLSYTEAAAAFPTLQILNGDQSTMQLKSIPEALNGWKVYCRFSNNSGATDTARATISVTTSTDGAPKITKSPTGETVAAGGSAYFVANHEGAIWAVWHFVSPDSVRDLSYSDAAAAFPTLQIINGDRPTMQLKSIPTALNGWKVYCRFSNNIGYTDTAVATITVTGSDAFASVPGSGNTVVQDTPVNTALITGTYVDSIAQRASLRITGGPTVYDVTVDWSSSYAETSNWTFSGSFDGRGVMQYNNATMVTTTYKDNGSGSVVTNYSNGTGYLQFTGSGQLIWHDDMTQNPNRETTFNRG